MIQLVNAQQKISFSDADYKSYDLYYNGKWKELIKYGEEAIKDGNDFNYLRLRMGYAAFMLQNYSEALKHYNAVLSKDSYHEIAHYYAWLCLINLHQQEQAYIHVPYFSKETKDYFHPAKRTITSLGWESSFKTTNVTTRNNSMYNKITLNSRLGWRINMEHSFATHQQNINEEKFIYINNNQNIQIKQKEYYNKTTVSLNRKWQLKAAYHYLQTPFNSLIYRPDSNLVYNNKIWLMGLKYFANYFTLQVSLISAKLADSNIHQYTLQSSYYPYGNMNVYGISTISIKEQNNIHSINVHQVAGCKLTKKTWLEGNITLGSFSNITENDALYVYNAVDENQFKGGMNVYLLQNEHILVMLGYTFEQRKLYKTDFLFYQHSINGGLTWKF